MQKFHKKKNLIKRETFYKDNSKYYTEFTNDRKGRVINKKEFSKKNIMTSDVYYTYKGNIKTEKLVNFSSSDGSIVGNYTTIFENDVKKSYKTESKYGKSSTNYTYNKQGDLSGSNYSGKTSYTNKYDYVYDRKDNWIKKHYRSGKYQYFYFREIHFANGDVTGSTDFDKKFINKLGNFENVEVVPLKRRKIIKKNSNNTFALKSKSWNFNYVFINNVVKKLAGKIDFKTSSNSLKLNSDANFKINFKANTYTFNFNVSDYKELDDKYQWTLTNSNDESGLLYVFKKQKVLNGKDLGKDVYVNGLLKIVEKSKSAMSFYLK